MHSSRVSITKNMYFDKAHFYDKKNLKFQEFADDKWYKEDDKLFVNPTDIWDASKPSPEWHTIAYKNLQICPYFDKSCGLSPISDISNSVGDQEYEKEDNATFKDEESYL